MGLAKRVLYWLGGVGGRGQRYTPIFTTTFFRTLAYYSYLVIPYCPLFKFSIYYVIIVIMKSSPFALTKQKLSRKAAAAKKARDIAAAKTPDRRRKKAENQRIGQRSDSDLHHDGSKVKRISIKNNRGFYGKGTKTEKA